MSNLSEYDFDDQPIEDDEDEIVQSSRSRSKGKKGSTPAAEKSGKSSKRSSKASSRAQSPGPSAKVVVTTLDLI